MQVGAVVLDSSHTRVLMQKQMQWTLPVTQVLPGESPEVAIQRLMLEVGILGKLVNYIPKYELGRTQF